MIAAEQQHFFTAAHGQRRFARDMRGERTDFFEQRLAVGIHAIDQPHLPRLLCRDLAARVGEFTGDAVGNDLRQTL